MRLDTAIPVSKGATAEVLRAFDPDRDEHVAVKLLLDDDADLIARMEREARNQQRLNHPNICPVYEVGEMDGRRCILMRFIDGKPIDEIFPTLDSDERVRLMRPVIDAVAAAHKAGVIHRDLKPANILVERFATGLHPWVVDFGLARSVADTTLTQYGQALGTPGYMAPEQARGERRLDSRCDVYSLGVLLFEAVTGRRPHEGDSVAELLVKAVSEDAPDVRRHAPQAPESLARIINQCLERGRVLRYRNAAELRDDLDAYLGGQPVQARRSGYWLRWRRAVLRSPRLSATVGALLVAALFAGGLATFSTLSRHQYAQTQTRLVHEYAGFAADLENRLRLIHARPVHDISEEVAAIEKRAEALASRAPAGQRVAEGPIRYALGRVWFALGDYERARRELNRAWDTGLDDPEIAFHLGRTQLALYGQALRRLRLEPDSGLRRSEEARLEEDLLRPSLALLARVGGSDAVASDQREFARALLAHYQGHGDKALDILAALARRSDWPAPALVLAGAFRVEHATARSISEHASLIESELKAAAEVLDQAMDLVRSDPEAYRTRCRIDALRLNLRVEGLPATADSDPDREACRLLVRINPANPENLVAATAAAERMTALLRQRNQNPEAVAMEAYELANRALSLDQNNAEAWYRRGRVAGSHGSWVLNDGGDPGELFEQAIHDLEQAVELQPMMASWYLGLSSAYEQSGRWQYIQGGSGDEAYRRAVNLLDQASQLPNVGARIRVRLPYTLSWQAYYLYTSGRVADEVLRHAVQTARGVVADFPNLVTAHVALGYAAWTYADYLHTSGRSPEPFASEAVAAYDRVLELDPDRYAERFNRLGVVLLLIEGKQRQDQSAEQNIRRATELLADLHQRYPDDLGLHVQRASLEYMKARQSLLMDGDPRPHLKAAHEALVEIPPGTVDQIEALVIRAVLAVLETRWRLENNRFSDMDFESRYREIGQALEQHPEVREAWAERARLAFLAAGSETIDDERRQALRQQASRDLKQALSGNEVLSRRYADLAEQLGIDPVGP